MLNKYLLCSGVGKGSFPLTSFDNALYNSGIANYNLVKVSSILPVKMELNTSVDIVEGSVLFTAYSTKTTIKRNEIISAAVAVGIPKDTEKVGVIMEFSGSCNKQEAETKITSMVKEAMSLRNYEIKEIICQAIEAKGSDKNYTTVFAALAMW